ncbi:MAG: hypothetical protein EOP11_07865 [Proteobacteria bacterium]|nr:MAG: hypothetical protein EOP11_07865 [Pseudomonadota bacterium]
MKILSLGLLLLTLTNSASAAVPPLPAPTKPIRQATVRIRVINTFLAYGDIGEAREEVCEVGGEIPVFDFSRAEGEYKPPAHSFCDATIDGKKMRVQIDVAMSYVAGLGAEPARKEVYALLLVSNKKSGPYSVQPTKVSSTDLSTRNFEFWVSSPQFESPRIKAGTRTISAIITVDDVNQ